MNPADKPVPTKKVFDVMKPGHAPAHANSRPVIRHRQAVRDPDINHQLMSHNPQASRLKPVSDNSLGAEAPPAHNKLPDKTDIRAAGGNSAFAERLSKPAAQDESGAGQYDPHRGSDELTDTQPATSDQVEPGEKPGVPPIDNKELAEEIRSELSLDAKPDTAAAQKPQSGSAMPSTPKTPLDSGGSLAPTPRSPSHETLHMDMPRDIQSSRVVVSHHKRRGRIWLAILAILLILLLLAAIGSLLLDAGLLNTDLAIPHTDFFSQ